MKNKWCLIFTITGLFLLSINISRADTNKSKTELCFALGSENLFSYKSGFFGHVRNMSSLKTKGNTQALTKTTCYRHYGIENGGIQCLLMIPNNKGNDFVRFYVHYCFDQNGNRANWQPYHDSNDNSLKFACGRENVRNCQDNIDIIL